MTDENRIKALGGPTRVAELLGYDKFGPQRVSNWIKRGIPAQVKVDHPDLFMRPIAEGVQTANAATAEAGS